MSNIFSDLHQAQAKQDKQTETPAQKVTSARESSRENPRSNPREFPTRDEIQEFSFRLRDELKLKAKVQAEVPYRWQEELEEMAHDLKVKKLELYRYIIGAFLNKVEHKKE